ncbi:MAG: alpha/beta fold hydrolase [Christensenellales bacterium]|jgi:pimeloyl-ACP methyl ester carboxylesterase
MPKFISNGIELSYIDEGQGLPFIFLHGLGGDIQQILSSFDVSEGIRLISLDMQGHGKSQADWGDYNFNSLANDVISLMDFLKLNKAAIGGISMGAAVSINIAVRFPEKIQKLLLVRPAWINKPMDEDKIRLFSIEADYLKNNDMQGFINTKEYKNIKAKSEYTANSFSKGFSNPASLKNYNKFAILPGLCPFSSTEQLKRIDAETLILACRNDWIHPYEYAEFYKKHIKNSVLRELPSKDADEKTHMALLKKYIKEFLTDGEGL